MIFFLGYVVALIRAVCLFRLIDDDFRLLRCSILRHGLGTFADCVLGQFAGEEKAHGCLNFTAANGRLFVLKTLLSIFLSTKSLTAQPNDLVKMTPITNIPKILMSGIPLLDSHNAQRVGHRSKKIPMGLLSLSRFMNGRILII